MKALLGPLGKLDCLYLKKIYFHPQNDWFLTSFEVRADTEPSTTVTYNLHNKIIIKVLETDAYEPVVIKL